MPRYDKYVTLYGTKGINQQRRLIDPVYEVSDARNVWAPNGYIEARPGYVGASGYQYDATSFSVGTTAIVTENTDVSPSTYSTTAVLNALDVGDRWYYGFTNAPSDSDYVCGLNLVMVAGNTNAIRADLEYYNGVSWVGIPHMDVHSTPPVSSATHLGVGAGAAARLCFVLPRDVTSTSVNGTTLYWLRLTLHTADGSATALDASVEIDTSRTLIVPLTGYVRSATCVARFPFQRRYVRVAAYSGNLHVINSGAFNQVRAADISLVSSGQVYLRFVVDAEPAQIAVVPHYNECYVAYNHAVAVLSAYPTSATNVDAGIETDTTLVGSGARYDPAEINQLAVWPTAKYILFFKGKLWVANLEGEPYTVRWSAPEPAYRVWPTINAEVLMENDNSPITGLYGYQEHATVLKNDSIWKMVEGDVVDGLETYVPVRVVNGVGCVSNSSIVEIRNRLVFLAEDGVYAYDGTSQIEKLSDRIQQTIDSIVPGRRAFAAACNWKAKSLYLLAVATNGSTNNNLVLAYDYKNDAWWLWDDMEVATWLVDEDSGDNERVYFADSRGRIFELGCGLTSNGAAISSYFVSAQLSDSHQAQTLREISTNCQNTSRSVSIEAMADDAVSGDSFNQTATFTYTDTNEAEYDAATYGTDKYVADRDRIVRNRFRLTGERFKLKVSHSTKNAKFVFNEATLGLVKHGGRN